MERWASNTLRVLGIVVTAITMVLGCLLLLLLSMCAWGGGFEGGGGHKDQAVGYLVGVAVLLAIGIFIIAKLGKGIARSGAAQAVPGVPADASAQPLAPSFPAHISPARRNAIQYLIYAIVAELVFACGSLMWRLFSMARSPDPYQHYGLMASLILFAAYRLPYIVLLAWLILKPDRRTFAFALAIPTVLIIQTLYHLPMTYLYLHYAPGFLLLSGVSFVLQLLILWLAWQASQHLGLRHEPASLVVAGLVSFLYFGFFGDVANTWIYRLFWR